MRQAIAYRLTLLLAIAILAGACSGGRSISCERGRLYRDAETVGQLRIPDGLTAPDETDALRVPGSGSPGEPVEATDGCLEYSPAFQTEPESEPEE